MFKVLSLCFCAFVILHSCRGVKFMESERSTTPDKERSMIAIFMDGTKDKPFNKPSQARKNTHVKRLHALAYPNIRTLYIEGVGAGNWIDAINAGTTGKRVMKAYRFLSENYRTADTICLFGFSRGANQCRILSSIIYTIGLLNLTPIKGTSNKDRFLLDLYKIYSETSGLGSKKDQMVAFIKNWNGRHPNQEINYKEAKNPEIELMALWDTVEALNTGDKKEITTPLPTHLNQLYNVKKLYHALSLDDNRAYNYSPILATHKDVALAPGQDINKIVEEVWFNGSHREIGGGVRQKNDSLTSISLQWMLSRIEPYHIFRDTTITVKYPFAKVNNMRSGFNWFTSLGADSLRGIDKYWQAMNPSWNNHRIKVHRTVIDRLERGIVQDFKRKGRRDWYDWPPFNKCFERRPDNTIHFKKEMCDCIEVVD